MNNEKIITIDSGLDFPIVGIGASAGGLGAGATTCSQEASVYGCLENGYLMRYDAPIVDSDGPSSPTFHNPALLGMPYMRKRNFHIGCRRDEIYIVPDNCEDQIIWRERCKCRIHIREHEQHNVCTR